MLERDTLDYFSLLWPLPNADPGTLPDREGHSISSQSISSPCHHQRDCGSTLGGHLIFSRDEPLARHLYHTPYPTEQP